MLTLEQKTELFLKSGFLLKYETKEDLASLACLLNVDLQFVSIILTFEQSLSLSSFCQDDRTYLRNWLESLKVVVKIAAHHQAWSRAALVSVAAKRFIGLTENTMFPDLIEIKNESHDIVAFQKTCLDEINSLAYDFYNDQVHAHG